MSLSQGSNAILNQKLGYQAYNRLKNNFIKATDPGDLQEGMLWFDSALQKMMLKKLAGLVDLVPAVSVFPEGMIIPWSGGYFTNAANAGYTRVLGTPNDAAGINALLNAKGWYVCDGAALNIPESTIYDGAGRYLPNLTDDRFLMGDNLVGVIGGANSNAHTHVVGSLVNAAEAAHTHAVGSLVNAAEAAHTHGNGTLAADAVGDHNHSVDPPSTTSSAASAGNVSSGSYAHTVTLADHTHDVDIGSFNSGDGGGHSHSLSGATAAGSSHNHAISGSTAAGSSHNHAISGDTGAASVSENRPVFLGVVYLQYVLAA